MRAGIVLDGRYELLAPLGEGGMGQVWRGHDLRLGREVAVKTVRDVADPVLLGRLEREARAAGRLTHPHIVAVHDSNRVDVDGTPAVYVVMELLPGRSLADELAAGRPPLTRALGWAAQVADALSAVHAPEIGIVHRDLKPANVMITHGLAKLLDFGIARLSHGVGDTRLTASGVVVGSVEYMAPEQCLGSQDLDGRTDLYALGCLLHAMLTGRPPFPSSLGPVQVLFHHVHQPPPDLGISPVLDGLVRDLLAKDPADRPADATTVRDALRALAGAIPSAGATPNAGPAPSVGATPNAGPTPTAVVSPVPGRPAYPPTVAAAPTGPDVRASFDARLTQARSTATVAPDQATALLEQFVPEAARALGSRDRTTLAARALLVSCCRRTGADDRAVWLLRQLKDELAWTDDPLSEWADAALADAEQAYQAERVPLATLRLALHDLTVVGAADTRTGLDLRAELAWALSREGEPAEALHTIRTVVPHLRDDYGSGDWPQLMARYQLGEIAAEAGHTAEAIATLCPVVLEAAARLGPTHWLTVTACEALGSLDEAAEQRLALLGQLRAAHGTRRTRRARQALLGD
ncbi:serine/threonine-protein kinase [Streptomyces hainanensis]|uniref:non-specific serine/threonine protein kinase n=1 Tax=Streptomyces hainanensis TaxID=402648 RepID=A0A4R4TWH9_9ACTN|nr:serine/threonine-protein kinase [Streptomyces hainanensis]TDC78489.1 serine/threonine protein kinase [Streptomyces hainanensis]